MKYDELIDQLIFLKDKLKEDGYSWRDYDCINDACNALEEEQRKEN